MKNQFWSLNELYNKDCDLIISGMSENTIDNKEILIFPNPTNGQLNINSMESFERIELFDCLGILIRQYKNDDAIYISNIENGFYILVITNKNGSKFMKKLIINGH